MTIASGFAWLESVSAQMKADVERGEPPTPVATTIRSFMDRFGYARRGGWIVGHINRHLQQLDLMTIPYYDDGSPIDSAIAVTLRTHTPSQSADDSSTGETAKSVRVDPILRISDLETVINKPVSVNANATLSAATTIMLRQDYSQLPVMEGDRNVRGVISWESIGTRLSLNVSGGQVRDFMVTERLNEKIIPSDRPLLEVINLVIEHGYILVLGRDRTLTGILTATDLSDQFRNLAEPFLLIREIEGHLRNLLMSNFSVEEIKGTLPEDQDTDRIATVDDLSFGQCWYMLEHDDRWSRVGLNIDRVQFINLLKVVNEVRNDAMHFRPKGLSDEDIGTLTETASFLQRLAQVGAI